MPRPPLDVAPGGRFVFVFERESNFKGGSAVKHALLIEDDHVWVRAVARSRQKIVHIGLGDIVIVIQERHALSARELDQHVTLASDRHLFVVDECKNLNRPPLGLEANFRE